MKDDLSDSDISDDEDDDDDDDVVLQELGESSDDEESDSENEQMLLPRKSRTGRACTTYLTRHFYGDSD